MKKYGKSTKKGFTLVELIVVLVILAVLAAMLVPALTGYIKRARQEKDYQMAATVLTAAQSAATYQYSKGNPAEGKTLKIDETTDAGNSTDVEALIGDASGKIEEVNFKANDKGIIEDGYVKIGDYYYSWTATDAEWTSGTTKPSTGVTT